MSLADTIARNDELRRDLKGGVVLFSPSVMELDARMRGRLIYRISLVTSFHAESDHSEGVVIFAGFTVIWYIDELDGELRMHVVMEQDL